MLMKKKKMSMDELIEPQKKTSVFSNIKSGLQKAKSSYDSFSKQRIENKKKSLASKIAAEEEKLKLQSSQAKLDRLKEQNMALKRKSLLRAKKKYSDPLKSILYK